ncbi:glycoprotease family-domain-containing protein [Coniella lustricola]|uniref:Glycoprotease family-domain-containing protein n=1 Tax=Coniella lustricola TaxID=2025994 RepID=A0A2T3AMI7_9PEZI|nr:glycoprotease family-domain-containing protein [Coniella lustricola]
MAGQVNLLRWAARPMFCRRSLFQAACLTGSRNFTVMGIETSADDTCVAVLELDDPKGAVRIICNKKATYPNKEKGGIHPAEAVKHHFAQIPGLVHAAMQHLGRATKSPAYLTLSHEEIAWSAMRGLPYSQYVPLPEKRYQMEKPDLIAVTQGPGIGTCLNAGIATAKALSVAWAVPLVAVHHMQAHALTPFMEASLVPSDPSSAPSQHPTSIQHSPPQYPILTLLVSGKHTQLVHTISPLNHRILASTPNIAIGDMLDKIARALLPRELIEACGNTIVYPRILEDFIAPLNPNKTYQASTSRKEEDLVYKSVFGWVIGRPPAPTAKNMQYNFSGMNGVVLNIIRENPDMPDDERRILALHTMRIAFEHASK